jgi:hypothetical protein
MKIFDLDIDTAREQFADQGWVLVRGGMSAQFLAELEAFAKQHFDESKLDAHAIKGKKEQALYTFPESVDYPGELFDVISSICGLDREGMTLSERHMQSYEANANANPPAHKDRAASQISVGFSVAIPDASRLLLWPSETDEVNEVEKATYVDAGELPDGAIRIDDRPGDIVMFRGHRTWHLRENSAGAVNLYVKVNDYGADPLGEGVGAAQASRA